MSVRVKLVTRDSELRVDENPISVPADLKRYGLSEVVNQLLQNTESVPFDFLVDGQLLRGPLQQYLADNGLSNESIITLEYVRAIMPPTFMAAFEHDDWVSSAHISRSSKHHNIATGCFDGVVRVWDRSGSVINQLAGHRAAVLAVQWISATKLVSGGRDRNLHIYNTEGRELSAVLRGHTAAVTSIAVLPQDKIVSGSMDNTLRLWTARTKELPDFTGEAPSKSQASTKRRRVSEKALSQARYKTSFQTLEGHSAPVTGLAAHPVERDVVYSVSEDHSVKTWDLVTSQCIDTKQTNFSLLSLASLGTTTQLLACGSSARHISLVDPRSGTHASVKQLNGHRNFVSSIAPNGKNGYQFASASHDGTVKMWDVRADRALFTLDRPDVALEERDLYCVDWYDFLVSGGRNKQLELTDTSNSLPV